MRRRGASTGSIHGARHRQPRAQLAVGHLQFPHARGEPSRLAQGAHGVFTQRGGREAQDGPADRLQRPMLWRWMHGPPGPASRTVHLAHRRLPSCGAVAAGGQGTWP